MNADLPPFLPPTAQGMARAAALLKAGDIVALPTETVYGLAANALDETAVRKVFNAKGRPLRDPLIVHGLGEGFFRDFAVFTPTARALAKAFWPGPLTLVLRKTAAISPLITAGRDTVAVRAPAHPLMRGVIEACGLPLAAPSANPFGYLSPTRAEHVRASFGTRVPWILDGGACDVGLESTIVDASDEAAAPRILRPGPIAAEAVEKILGRAVALGGKTRAKSGEGMPAPGMMDRHYSPRTPLVLLEDGATPAMPKPGRRAAWVRLNISDPAGTSSQAIEIFRLAESGDLAGAAHNLYDLLRQLDTGGYATIWCDVAPDNGLGRALNDRLRRAAAKAD